MKIAIPSTSKDLSANIDLCFGRAANFFIIDTQTYVMKFIENNYRYDAIHNAGKEAAYILEFNDVDLLIAWHCGHKSFQHLQQAGIEIILGAMGSIADAVVDYLNGKLDPALSANIRSNWLHEDIEMYNYAC